MLSFLAIQKFVGGDNWKDLGLEEKYLVTLDRQNSTFLRSVVATMVESNCAEFFLSQKQTVQGVFLSPRKTSYFLKVFFQVLPFALYYRYHKRMFNYDDIKLYSEIINL